MIAKMQRGKNHRAPRSSLGRLSGGELNKGSSICVSLPKVQPVFADNARVPPLGPLATCCNMKYMCGEPSGTSLVCNSSGQFGRLWASEVVVQDVVCSKDERVHNNHPMEVVLLKASACALPHMHYVV